MGIGDERLARIKIEARSEKLSEDLRAAREKLKKFGRDAKTAIGKTSPSKFFRDAAGAAGKATSNGIGRIGIGFLEKAGSSIFDLATDGIRDTMDYERALARFQISAGRSDEQINTMRISLTNMAKSMGISKNELLSGASAYVALTGDADGAVTSMQLFGRVALASGADMADIATTAASLKDNLKIDPSQFEAAFSTMIAQGKAGAIELKDLATELSGVAPQFTAFANGTGVGGLTTLGAALQTARKGFGTASEAATGLKALMVAINRNAGKFSSVKIGGTYGFFNTNPKTGEKTLKDFKQIIDGIAASKLAKDPTLLTKAFGSDEAKRAYDQLTQNRTLLGQLEKSFADTGQVAADSAKYQASAAGQMEIALQNMREAVTKAFTPENIVAFAQSLMKVAEYLGKIVQALNDVQDFFEVRDMKNRNEAQLAAMGEYSGDDRDLQQKSNMAARRKELEEIRSRPARLAAQAKRTVSTSGAGALSLIGPSKLGADIAPSVLPGVDPGITSLSSRGSSVPQVFSGVGFAQSRAPVEVIVRLEQNAIATAKAEAKSQRRKPGGR